MNIPRIYLLTPNSPAPGTLRVWTGQSLHSLRQCSLEDIGHALVEMQERMENLQQDMATLQQVMDQLAAVSAGSPEISKKGSGVVRPAGVYDNGRASKGARMGSVDQEIRRVPVFRNISQKGTAAEAAGRGKRSRIRGHGSPL
jgi:hypothetical protein